MRGFVAGSGPDRALRVDKEGRSPARLDSGTVGDEAYVMEQL